MSDVHAALDAADEETELEEQFFLELIAKAVLGLASTTGMDPEEIFHLQFENRDLTFIESPGSLRVEFGERRMENEDINLSYRWEDEDPEDFDE